MMEYYKEGLYYRGELKIAITQDSINGQKRIHMSVSHFSRLPTWTELKIVREELLPMNRDFIMFFPREEDYINLHPYCLHLTELKPSDKLNNFIDRKDGKEPLT